ncbi:MAG: MFS transporter [Thaumarchaeota archaeon]|nr:MFS transporter [Nitrososphaerota archaeon]MDE1839837.1 MFS transporter [Nitrososphaerota archaeon]
MDDNDKVDHHVTRISSSAWTSLAIISSLALVTMYGETMVLPAIPNFIKDFGISYNMSSWILSSYLIAGAVMTPIAGKLSDMYGKKKILLVVMMIYAIGILGGGFANSFYFMIFARIAQGIGISMFPIAFGIVRDIFPKEKLAIAQGIFTSTFFGGSVVGLIVGARIISSYGWHATFFSVFPIAMMLAVIMAKFIRIPKIDPGKYHGLDIKGAIALSVTVILFLMGVSYLEDIAIGNLNSLVFFAGSTASMLVFMMLEKRTPHPLIDLNILANKILLPTNVILMIVGISTFMVYQTIPILIQSPKPLGFGGDAISTANVQLPFMVISLIVSAASGFIVSKVGNFRLTALGTLVCTAGFFGLVAFHSTEFMISIALGIISVGLSFAFVGGFNIILVSSPPKVEGISLGMSVLLILVGQSLGPSVAGMFQQMYSQTIPNVSGVFPSALSYTQIFSSAGMISIISVVLVVVLRNKVRTLASYNSKI